jgi:hypothetical protein
MKKTREGGEYVPYHQGKDPSQRWARFKKNASKTGLSRWRGRFRNRASSPQGNEKPRVSAGQNGLWLGFRRGKEEGPYEMLADWDGQRKTREKVLGEIHQAYSQEKILDLARVRGYAVTKNRVNEKGQIEMVLRKLG